jgi:hypothetical protein
VFKLHLIKLVQQHLHHCARHRAVNAVRSALYNQMTARTLMNASVTHCLCICLLCSVHIVTPAVQPSLPLSYSRTARMQLRSVLMPCLLMQPPNMHSLCTQLVATTNMLCLVYTHLTATAGVSSRGCRCNDSGG